MLINRYQALSAGQRNWVCRVVGALLGLLLGLVHPFLHHICGLRVDSCLPAGHHLPYGIIPAGGASADHSGLSQRVSASSLPYYGSFNPVLAFSSALFGILLDLCHYYGRGDDWRACIL